MDFNCFKKEIEIQNLYVIYLYILHMPLLFCRAIYCCRLCVFVEKPNKRSMNFKHWGLVIAAPYINFNEILIQIIKAFDVYIYISVSVKALYKDVSFSIGKLILWFRCLYSHVHTVIQLICKNNKICLKRLDCYTLSLWYAPDFQVNVEIPCVWYWCILLFQIHCRVLVGKQIILV